MEGQKDHLVPIPLKDLPLKAPSNLALEEKALLDSLFHYQHWLEGYEVVRVGVDEQTPQDIKSPSNPRAAEGPGKMFWYIPSTCADTSLKSWDPFKGLAGSNKWRRVKAREIVLPQQRQEKKPFKARLQFPVVVSGCSGNTEPSAMDQHIHEMESML